MVLQNLNYKDKREAIDLAQKNEWSLSEVLSEVLNEKDYDKVLHLAEYLEEHEAITPREAKNIIGKSAATVRRYLNILVNAGVVNIEGSTNKVIYKKSDSFRWTH